MFTKTGISSGITSSSKSLIFFHDYAMIIIVAIIVIISGIMFMLMSGKFTSRSIYEEQMLEVVWTVLPAIVLLGLALPSLRILYMVDETMYPSLTVKCIGHQWYWSYEYEDFSFDSYMSTEEDLNMGEYRLLDVDNRVILPVGEEIRFVTTSSDVIHSWTVPSLGIKSDAIPGRLNETSIIINKLGVFYGQCSEICGANHAFMPIVVESVPLNEFYLL